MPRVKSPLPNVLVPRERRARLPGLRSHVGLLVLWLGCLAWGRKPGPVRGLAVEGVGQIGRGGRRSFVGRCEVGVVVRPRAVVMVRPRAVVVRPRAVVMRPRAVVMVRMRVMVRPRVMVRMLVMIRMVMRGLPVDGRGGAPARAVFRRSPAARRSTAPPQNLVRPGDHSALLLQFLRRVPVDEVGEPHDRLAGRSPALTHNNVAPGAQSELDQQTAEVVPRRVRVDVGHLMQDGQSHGMVGGGPLLQTRVHFRGGGRQNLLRGAVESVEVMS